MKARILYIPILLLFSLSFVDCAKKGTPSGGAKDSIPPVIVKSNPENFNINFTGDEIRIYFNEYIRLKDLQKELIVSPPLKNAPLITPLNASKVLKIKILDTLKENTTYSFNFGNSIVDNNEGNAYKYFKYVFSTGSYIDSLKVSGKVTDALLLKPEIPITVILHEVNESFKDSLVFTEKPTYVTTTVDSIGSYELSNLKEGKYLLMALKETNSDYAFQPINDKVAFEETIISLPTDSSYVLTLFKEKVPNKIGRGKHEGKNHIAIGFEGDAKDLALEVISEVPENFEHSVYNSYKSDSLHYYFRPELEVDSLVFIARNYESVDTLNVRIRDLYKDTLRLTAINGGVLTIKDTLKILVNTPIRSVNSENVLVMDKDSMIVKATINFDEKFNIAKVIFPKTEQQKYQIQLLPGTVTDFFENSNDTLNVVVTTKANSDYGTLNLTIENAKQQSIIVELVNNKFEVVSKMNLSENKAVFFEYIPAGKYYLRMIYDENQNGIWDTGNFLLRLKPEKIIYYPSKIEVRANWSLNETFTLD